MCADPQLVNALPESWFAGKKKHASLDGLVMLMSSKLPTMLYHASLGAPDMERKKARLVRREICYVVDR